MTTSAISIADLQAQIATIIQADNFDINTLISILNPASTFTTNPLFVQNIDNVISILTQDRDGNSQFDMQDLVLLGQDPMAVLSLVNSILLITCSIPGLQITYNSGTTEILVFKLLAYIFLVIVPSKTGHPLTLEEKNAILQLALTVYEMIQSTGIIQQLLAEIKAKLQSKGWCTCLVGTTANTKEAKLEKHLPLAKLELKSAMTNIRHRKQLNKIIDEQKKNI
jgi:hypothetical protein